MPKRDYKNCGDRLLQLLSKSGHVCLLLANDLRSRSMLLYIFSEYGAPKGRKGKLKIIQYFGLIQELLEFLKKKVFT